MTNAFKLLKSYCLVQTSIEKKIVFKEFMFANVQRKIMTSRFKREIISYVSHEEANGVKNG
jgi:hypothetical protein